MTTNDYRKLWLKLHKSYEKKAFRIFLKGLRSAAKKIPFDNLDKYNYQASLEFNVSIEDITKAYYNAYLEIGLLYGKRVTRGIVRDSKGLEVDIFTNEFRSNLINWITNNAGLRIKTVRQSLINYLLDEINNGIGQGYDIREISKQIEKLVNSRSFYRWQAMRIARTETTAAANYGATIASGSSLYVIEKIWISSNDARTRQIEKGDKHDHLDMHLVTVGEKEAFNVQGDMMMFPGDPNGSASNVINCRCTVAMKPKRDANGRLVRKKPI